MATTTPRRAKVMMGIRVTPSTRTAFRVWCAQRGQTIQQVIEADVRKHLLQPAVGPVPRNRALVLLSRPRSWRRLLPWARS